MQRKSDVVTLWLRRLFALLAVIVAFSGCAPSSTPPGPDVAGGKVEQGGFTFMRWKEGLAIMIWHNLESSTHHGSGSTTDPVYRLQGDAESQDGRHVDWRLETTDGKTAQFWIDNTPYDLSSGTLFIITTKNERTEVRQLQRDLSGVQTNYESCIAFARSDPDLASFISDPAGAEPTTSPPGQVPSMGVHTPEDVQRYFDSWPEDYKLSIAEDVVVIFTFPDSTAQFIGGAVIYHIPSVSSAVLDFEGNLDSRNTHYESDEARARLETVLADADLMARLQTRINEIWGAYLNEDEGAAGPGDPLSEFQALLVRAVETHDFDLMQALMGDSFGLGGWRSEGWVYSPDEAIQQLRLNYLKADNDIRFQDAPDLSQQLGGRDILSVWDPAVNPVSALHSTGWASDGKAEAFLIVAQ
ncbi:MAG TPA: hypothetical protein VMY80_04575, partial [Anaerolineae bacterium]|nr:hypothetical protein [Anaerolineae bacterium]